MRKIARSRINKHPKKVIGVVCGRQEWFERWKLHHQCANCRYVLINDTSNWLGVKFDEIKVKSAFGWWLVSDDTVISAWTQLKTYKPYILNDQITPN